MIINGPYNYWVNAGRGRNSNRSTHHEILFIANFATAQWRAIQPESDRALTKRRRGVVVSFYAETGSNLFFGTFPVLVFRYHYFGSH